MLARAIARYIRVSPRKVRDIVRLLKGRSCLEAVAILENLNKGHTKDLVRVINSAVDSATRNDSAKKQDLYISNMIVNEGPMLKRFKAQAMGRATIIRRRTAHIIVELDKKVKVRKKDGA